MNASLKWETRLQRILNNRKRQLIMDSYSLNKINHTLNFISGNFFPLKSGHDNHSMKDKCYMVFTRIMTIIFFTIIVTAVFFIPLGLALQKNVVCIVVVTEVIIVSTYIDVRLSFFQKLMMKLQEILIDDLQLKEIISSTLDPISKPLKVCVVCNSGMSIVVNLLPLLKLFDQNQFTYSDFSMPCYFPNEPFDKTSFAFGALIQTTSSFYTVFKKSAIDVYMINIIALLTAHYKYLRHHLVDVLDGGEIVTEDENNNFKDGLLTWIKRHQCILEISRMLKYLIAPYVFIIYVNGTFTLCFLAFMTIKVPSDSVGKYALVVYGVGNLIQLYMLCHCAQELLDASTSVSTKAFHVNWFMRCESTKRAFDLIIMADKLETRLSAFGMFDLSLSTYTEIIQHAYSACLILLNVGE